MSLSQEEQNRIADSVGLGLAVVSLVHGLVRFYQFPKFLSWEQPRKNRMYVLLLVFSALQTVHFSIAETATNREPDDYPVPGYLCLMVSLAALFNAFQLFISMWSDMLSFESSKFLSQIGKIHFVFTVLYWLFTLFLFFEVLLDFETVSGSEGSWAGQIVNIGGAVSFAAASTVYLIYGLLLQSAMKKLGGNAVWRSAIWKINAVMVISTFCCLSRVILLMYLECQVYYLCPAQNYFVWLVFAQWIPFYGLHLVMFSVTKMDGEFTKSLFGGVESVLSHTGSVNSTDMIVPLAQDFPHESSFYIDRIGNKSTSSPQRKGPLILIRQHRPPRSSGSSSSSSSSSRSKKMCPKHLTIHETPEPSDVREDEQSKQRKTSGKSVASNSSTSSNNHQRREGRSKYLQTRQSSDEAVPDPATTRHHHHHQTAAAEATTAITDNQDDMYIPPTETNAGVEAECNEGEIFPGSDRVSPTPKRDSPESESEFLIPGMEELPLTTSVDVGDGQFVDEELSRDASFLEKT